MHLGQLGERLGYLCLILADRELVGLLNGVLQIRINGDCRRRRKNQIRGNNDDYVLFFIADRLSYARLVPDDGIDFIQIRRRIVRLCEVHVRTPEIIRLNAVALNADRYSVFFLAVDEAL